MIQTETVPVFRLSGNSHLVLPSLPGGPQLFSEQQLTLAVRLADREALSCVRSFGQPMVSPRPLYPVAFREPDAAVPEVLRDFRDAVEWLSWRELVVVDGDRVCIKESVPR